MKKNLRLTSLVAFLMLGFFGVSAQYQGEGQYRLKNFGQETYMSYDANSDDILATDVITGSDILFNLVPNVANSGKFNLFTGDGQRFLIGVNGGTAKTSDLTGDINQADALITVETVDNVHGNGDTERYYLSVTPASGPNTGVVRAFNVKSSDAFDIGMGLYTNKNHNHYKWILEYVGGVPTAIGDEVKESTNYVYPVPSTNGIFNLKESTDWAVYSISGSAVAEGKGQLVDISTSPKGVYIIKYDGKTQKIMF
ncbi:T9SS type A sorting domain-containing protein [Saccharicrinis sp. GN24d3]|uniref:T9SS type A sorting domain-containing protein n=1 Tax=Saccharicrinis sp. GN24d3 TaxID=3458416 RepID=UPI0040350DB3